MPAYGASNTFVPGRFNVWLPQRTQSAYLSFDTATEAQAAVTAQQVGVILNPSGQIDPNVQAWSGWTGYQSPVAQPAVVLTTPPNPAAAMVTPRPGAAPVIPVSAPAAAVPTANPRPTAGKFDVYIPQAFVANGVVPNANNSLTEGAFLPFATLAEAQAYVSGSGMGVILEPGGAVSATQVWSQWRSSAPSTENYRLSTSPAANKFNVWFPSAVVARLGLCNTQAFAAGAYLSFDTAAQAQTQAQLRGLGVILDRTGSLDPTQPWNMANTFAAQLLNPQLTPKVKPGAFNVWFPNQSVGQLGISNAASFPNGAYLPFKTEAEAQAHVTARGGWGVVLGRNGMPTATQMWSQAAYFGAQLLNDQLSPTLTPGRFNVWFPLSSVGTLAAPSTAAFPNGAYLSFASEAEARAHATARGCGVILDGQGSMAATQTWNQATSFGAQLLNSTATAQPTAGQYSVWFPGAFVANAGLNAATFAGGAYIPFNTAADAQAHATQRGFGVVLDTHGAVDATQPWNLAGQFGTQLLNSLATPTQTPGKFSVWFPQIIMRNMGFGDLAPFPQGVFIAFDSRQEALAHCTARTMGVLVDDQSRLDAVQIWPSAQTYALQNPAILPAPPSGWVEGPTAVDPATAQGLGVPTAGSVAVGTITPTAKGADIVAYVATVNGSDAFQFAVGAQINGNWTPIFTVPDMVKLAATGWSQFVLHVDYDAIDAYLKTISPALGVTPGMSSAMGITFFSGHNTGIPGWSSNSGTEKDALMSLPARS